MAQAHLDGDPAGDRGRVAVPRRRRRRRCPPTGASRSCTRCAIPGTPARCSARPTPPGPTAWCSPPARSIRTTRRPCGPRPGRSSTCRSSAATRPPRSRARCASAGCAILAMDGRRRRRPVHRRPQRSRSRSCSATRRAGLPEEILPRWRTRRCACRIAGKAESLNLAAAATVCLFEWARRRASGAVALETIVAAAAHDIRSPLTAMKGFGYALEKRWESMTEEQRDADAPGDRLRRRPDGRDPAAAGRRRPRGGGHPRAVPRARRSLGARARDHRVRRAATPSTPRSAGRERPTSSSSDPARAQERRARRFIESQVWWGARGPDHDRGQAGGRPAARRPSGATGPSSRPRTRSGCSGRAPRHRGREQDRPVRRARRRRGAGRARVGGRRRTGGSSFHLETPAPPTRAEQGRLLDSAA